MLSRHPDMLRTPPNCFLQRSLCALFTAVFALAFLVPSFVQAQSQAQSTDGPTSLSLNQQATDSLAADGQKTFTIDLDAGQFVAGVADQISVDVVINVQAPDGSTVTDIDVSGEGPEPFQFETETAGTYTLVVTPFEEDAGAFSILVNLQEPIATTDEGRVRQLLHRFEGEAPGIAVGMIRDGELAFSASAGQAHLSHDVPFSVDIRSNIGSVSKQFTAMAVLLLEQDGKLSLDDPVTKHLPEIPEFEHTVTLRHLLTHTSGYREFFNTMAMKGVRFEEGDMVQQEDIIHLVQRQPELQNEPGGTFNYNNTGYQLLADIVAKVSGMPFPEFLDERIFQPLGMTNTLVRPNRLAVVDHSAQGYTMTDGQYREGFDLPGAVGAGGIYTTLEDMARWMDNFDTHEVGGAEAYEKMTTPYVLASGDTTNYGLGLFIQEQRGLKRIQHGGADLAHRAVMTYFPELDAGLVMMSNNATAGGDIPTDIINLFFGDDMEPAADETGDEKTGEGAAASDTSAFDPASMTPEDFETFTGRYELNNAPGFVLSFSQEDGTFYTQATGQPQLEIRPTGPRSFELLAVDAQLEFSNIEDGAAQNVTLFQNGMEQVGTRLNGEAWDPSPEELQAFTGRYFSDELQTTYTLVVEDETLVLTHARLDDISLTPGGEDEFSGAMPVTTVTFERNESGEIVALLAGSGRSTDIRFEPVE
jgi:CubicO group peptidase (beta-lactamase class C family)